MAETLKNGRYELKTAWKDTTNGCVAMFIDTHTRKEVFVKEFSKTRSNVGNSLKTWQTWELM